jgi:hypothetical protein
VRRLLLIAVLLAACSRPELPTSTVLWRVGEWKTPEGTQIRTAPAVFISFRKSGEYVEHYTRVIEQPDQTVYISSSAPHLVAVGRWKRRRNEVEATRDLVSANATKLCGGLKYEVGESSIRGAEGDFTRITRLVAPDFEDYINDAKRKGVRCPQGSD